MNGKVDLACVRCNENAQFVCGRCNVPYCSPTCQVVHWPFHRSLCFAMPSLRKISDPGNLMLSPSDTHVPSSGQRSVAKKSLTSLHSKGAVQHMNNETIYVDEDNLPKGKVVHYTPKYRLSPRAFVPHYCAIGCLHEVKHNLSSYSPLAKPLLSGWERRIIYKKSEKMVMYRAPCGRSLRNMSELRMFLRTTNCSLNVDNFDFDYLTRCLTEYVIDARSVHTQDLSNGSEPVAVPCVNYYDNTIPSLCVYSTKRVPNEDVDLILDDNFLCGCECEDDCMDKTKCQCWKVTLEGAQFGNPNTPSNQVGYQFKRLLNPVPTGIYECNSRCKCSKSCLNRVAQHALQLKLQVFKTPSRGWGVRCLNDIPKGSFICVLVGDLLTEQTACIIAKSHGDEYFAELDFIEAVESLKEGYEVGVSDDSDDDVATVSTEPQYTSDNTLLTMDSNNRNEIDPGDAQRQPTKNKSIHTYYRENERTFILDAKHSGNVGRFFNHSCSPNLFVQNVFVDTHDLRFPWVSFFSSSYIRAGSELTWNYNYDVGSVPGKVMYCKCGAGNCRVRLL